MDGGWIVDEAVPEDETDGVSVVGGVVLSPTIVETASAEGRRGRPCDVGLLAAITGEKSNFLPCDARRDLSASSFKRTSSVVFTRSFDSPSSTWSGEAAARLSDGLLYA